MVSGERSVRACDHAVTVNRLSSSVVAGRFDDVFVDCTSGGQKRPLTADQHQTIAKNREEPSRNDKRRCCKAPCRHIIERFVGESAWFFGQSV